VEQISLDSFRELRKKAKVIAASLRKDLEVFRHPLDSRTFLRLPNSDVLPKDVGVTVTASAVMALSTAGELSQFYSPKPEKIVQPDSDKNVQLVFTDIGGAKWKSSGLVDGNAFTTSLVLRAAGMAQPLIDAGINLSATVKNTPPLEDAEKGPYSDAFKGADFAKIAKTLGEAVPDSLGMGKYPVTSVIAYWFVDAIDRLSIGFGDGWWAKLADWTTREFTRQVSLVSAGYHEQMDPVAMAMAACLAQRIRTIGGSKKFANRGEIEKALPSMRELRHSIRLLFDVQLTSGVWNKYFPLFHYPDAGSNYCFSFEMLEAILHEFAEDPLLEEKCVFDGFQKATNWCEQNRLTYNKGDVEYSGWNSGGQLETLRKGMPESWATAVVHMYLLRLHTAMSDIIQKRVLRSYGEVTAKRSWEEVLDGEVVLSGAERIRAKKLIEDHILQPLLDQGVDREDIKDTPLEGRRSVLLFGPPGTAKTTLVRAFASKIKWPCIEITPTQFLTEGLPQIYERADQVFADLADLSGVVVFFDEMDALVQSRDTPPGAGSGLDVTSQFLTTSMLPKLAKLHGDGHVIFFMATNHQEHFDPAIKRPGRFDLLICLGPPTWSDKLDNIAAVWVGPGSKDDKEEVVKTLRAWTDGNSTACGQLDKFTVDEVKAIFDRIRKRGPLKEALVNLKSGPFLTMVSEWAQEYITLHDHGPEKKNPVLAAYEKDQKKSKVQ